MVPQKRPNSVVVVFRLTNRGANRTVVSRFAIYGRPLVLRRAKRHVGVFATQHSTAGARAQQLDVDGRVGDAGVAQELVLSRPIAQSGEHIGEVGAVVDGARDADGRVVGEG